MVQVQDEGGMGQTRDGPVAKSGSGCSSKQGVPETKMIQNKLMVFQGGSWAWVVGLVPTCWVNDIRGRGKMITSSVFLRPCGPKENY